MTRTLTRGERSLLLLFVMLVTAAVFARSIGFDLIAGREDLAGLRGEPGWREHPYPLTWWTWALDRTLWGQDPRGYHLQSWLWHVLDAGLAFVLLEGLLVVWARAPRGAAPTGLAAAAGALFFAIHPLRAEPVAWVSARGDAVSLAFLLLALLAYLRARAGRRVAWIALSVACTALSLLAGAWAITMPALLLVLDAGPLRRGLGDLRVWLEKAPWAAACALLVLSLPHQHAEPGQLDPYLHVSALPARVGAAFHALAFYPWATLLPLDLLPVYEMAGDERVVLTRFVLGGVIVAVAAGAAWRLRARAPAVPAALLAYALLVLPAMALAQGGARATADRCAYASCVPFAALYAYAAWRWRAMRLVAVPHLIALAAIAFVQCGIWRDASTLWTSTVERDSQNVHANLRLGEAEYRAYEASSSRGEREAAAAALTDALEHLRNAWLRDPRHPRVLLMRGRSLYATGREPDVRQANRLWRQALALRPTDPDAVACAELLLASKARYPQLFDEPGAK